MSDDDRLNNLADFSRLMLQWARSAEERMNALTTAQENSETKIAALADAQIRTEGIVSMLGEEVRELRAAQAHSDQRMDALIDVVRGMNRGDSPPQP